MVRNVSYVCIVSWPNDSLKFRFEMLVYLKVPSALCKLSFCECAVFAAHDSSSLGVHPCISSTRTCDFVGCIFLH